MLVLVVEVMGASTVVLYGINLLFTPDAPVYEPDADRPGLPKARPSAADSPAARTAHHALGRSVQRLPRMPGWMVEEGHEGMLRAGRTQRACLCRHSTRAFGPLCAAMQPVRAAARSAQGARVAARGVPV